MIKQIRNWIRKHEAITRKTAGLSEKDAAVQRKWEVAISILDERKEDIPVEIDRRKRIHA